MQLSPSPVHPLEFPIGDKTYTVPPAGIAAGMEIAKVLTGDKTARVKDHIGLFKLALGDVWDEMVADGAPYTEAWRVGMACVAREKVLLYNTGPDRWDLADKAAEAVWKSGIDPEALAAHVAALTSTTKPSTRAAAASMTPSPASGTGTTKARTTTGRKATRSPGRASKPRGR